MAAPVRLRGDFSSAQVRAFARRAKDADQVRRQPRSEGSRCRLSGIGCCASTRMALKVWKPARRRGRILSSTTAIDVRWPKPLRPVPFPPFMALFVGGSSTSSNGYGKSSKSRSASRRWGMNFGPWAIASSRPDHAIRGNALKILPLLKSLPRPSGANPKAPAQRHADRAVVAR